MAITTHSQIADFKAFFDAVSDGVTESGGGAYLSAPAPSPTASTVPGLADLSVKLDSVRELVEVLVKRLDSMQAQQPDEELAVLGAAYARAEAQVQVSTALLAERDEAMAKLWQQMFETVDPLLEAERKLTVQAQARVVELQSQLDSQSPAQAGIDMDALRGLIVDAMRGNLGEQLLPQVEMERSARVAAETRSEESSRRFEELQANQRQNDADLRRQLSEAFEPQMESERVRRAQSEERVVELEKRLELNEQARRSAEIDLRDQSESLSILRTELTHLSDNKQQLEWDIAQRSAATEHHEAMRLRLQAELDERNTAFEEVSQKNSRLELLFSEIGLQLTQQKNENVTLGRTVDSLRIDFGKKLEERSREVEAMGALETELRGLLQSAESKATDEQARHAENLKELNVKLAAERELNEAAVIKLREYEIQQPTADAAKLKQGAAQAPEFLAALPKPVIRVVPATTVLATELQILSLPSETKVTNFAPVTRVSTETIAREKSRLAVLALGTSVAPAKLYFQSVPWSGLSATTVSVDAVAFGDAENSLTSFAVATATQQAIDASHSRHLSNSNRVN